MAGQFALYEAFLSQNTQQLTFHRVAVGAYGFVFICVTTVA